MNSALTLNDQGVHMMSTGDYEGASAVFVTAIQQAKGHLQSSTSSLSGPQCFTSSSVNSVFPTLVSVEVHGHSSTDNSAAFAIFAECFVAGDDLPPHSKDYTEADNFLAATILYNGALAFHLSSHKFCKSTTSLLRRAARFYTIAQNILLETCMSTDQHWFLLLAISNNIAALAVETYEYKLLGKHRSVMGTAIMETQAVSEFFASNFVFSKTILEQPAPAA